MPLIQKNVDLIEVTIDGDTYWLKSALGWYDAQSAGLQRGIVLHVKTGDAKRGRFFTGGDDSLVPITLDGMEDATLDRLALWLEKWSHEENGKPVPLTRENIKRMEERHAQRLLRRIDQLEQGVRGPDPDSPLGTPPNGSSAPSSSKADLDSPLTEMMQS